MVKYIFSAVVLLFITFVYGHVAINSPNPKIPGFNNEGFCGTEPSSLPPFGQDNAGNNILQNVVGGTSFTFAYSLAHNFESLQSGRIISGDTINYNVFAQTYTLLIDGVAYTEGADNTLTVTMPLGNIPQASISVFSDELGYGGCVDFTIRCPIGTQGNLCADVNETAIAYLAGLQQTDPTAYQNAIAELNDPNLESIKTTVVNEVNSYNNGGGVSSGGGIAIAVFVIAFVGIVAGLLYYRHRDPEGFAIKMSNAKMHVGNAWDATKAKFSNSGSRGSTLPTTKSNTTPVATTKPVSVQPVTQPTRPNRPTAPQKATNETVTQPQRPLPPPKQTNINRATPPPPKQGGTKAPEAPAEEVQNADDYKYTPPVKQLPSKPDRPTPPPKRTT